MTELYPAKTDPNERTTYEPVLARITGTSQYRDDEYRLEGIEGYWSAGKVQVAQAVKDGAVAWFTLATKPKSGSNAKHGSMYRDIVSIQPASPEDKAAYDPQAQTVQSYAAREPASGQNGAHSAASGNIWDERDRQIKLGMAFNNLTTMLASGMFDKAETPEGVADTQAAWEQWWNWYGQASRGLPLTPVQPEEDTPATDPQIEELPWDEPPARKDAPH